MLENLSLPWLLGGGAVFGTFIISFWNYIKNFYHQIVSRIIVNIELEGYASEAMRFHLRNKFQASKWGKRHYIAWMLFVRLKNRVQLVAMEKVPSSGRVYWDGWKPLMSSSQSSTETGDSAVTSSAWDQQNLNISFIRGMFDIEELVNNSISELNNRLSKNNTGKRHYVKYIFGSAGKHKINLNEKKIQTSNIPTSSTDIRSCLQYRPLKYDFDELGAGVDGPNSLTLDNLALSSEAEKTIKEAVYWKENEETYNRLSVPWKKGLLLYGEPGTGKTAFARGISEKLDLPVYVFDLASLYNNELQEEWTNMLSNVPCMVLIEDIDNIFKHRENITKEGSLTFDCLINCLDGIFRNDGVFTIITTNYIDKIDKSLGSFDHNKFSARPGRIDKAIHFDTLTEDGRYKIAERILKEKPELIDKVVSDNVGCVGAVMQEKCVELIWEST